jgi:ribosomal protein L11 methyltransferase
MNDLVRFNFVGEFPEELDPFVQAVWWDEEGNVEGIVSDRNQVHLQKLVPHATFSPLEERDWLKEDEENLPPLEVGPFFIHGPHYTGEKRGWAIESAHAFGSGHHPTTHRCLSALLQLSKKEKISKALDLGCGSGILAMAIAHLWDADVYASDCEKESVEASSRNFQKNGFPKIKVYESFGFDHLALKQKYNLIVANIHSGPLCEMAPDVVKSMSPSGFLLLSGLLIEQEQEVKNAYSSLTVIESFYDNNWTTLLLHRARL